MAFNWMQQNNVYTLVPIFWNKFLMKNSYPNFNNKYKKINKM